MCDDYKSGSPQPFEVPGAHLLGSDMFYPFDFVAQAEDVFPTHSAHAGCMPYPPPSHRSQSFSSRLGRSLGIGLLFIACLACPIIIPVIFAARQGGRR